MCPFSISVSQQNINIYTVLSLLSTDVKRQTKNRQPFIEAEGGFENEQPVDENF